MCFCSTKKPEITDAQKASSLTHTCPEWFKDAKLGLFVDWGIYSIAGWAPPREQGAMYPDWYLYNMYHWDVWQQYHAETWGADFERDDFIPLFQADKYDPDGLAQLAAETGAKYLVPFAKHHDGFCLWPSSFTHRDALEMGPKRDLVQPLVDACRSNGLKFGFYFSIEEWEYPVVNEKGDTLLRIWNDEKPQTDFIPMDTKYRGRIGGKPAVRDFYGDYILPQAMEFLDLYDPDLLWFDGEWSTPLEETRTLEITDYFYAGALGRKEVVANDRLGMGTRMRMGDYFTSEFHELDQLQSKLMHPWEECRGISQSFGYNRLDTDDNVMSAKALIDMFVDIVSSGGNLLLLINLDGQGGVPEIQHKRLQALGKWLNINGEAIYATRPWLHQMEGAVRYTTSKDGKYLYAIAQEWPGEHLFLRTVFLPKGSKVHLLGTETELDWEFELISHGDNRLRIDIPEELRENKPCDHAWVFKMELY